MKSTKEKKKLKANVQLKHLLNCKKRFAVLQGGTRSGKTYAVCQYIAYLIRTETQPLVISVIRKTLPALKASVQRDLIQILEDMGTYYAGVHNKAENTFRYKNHLIEFLSVDEPQKIRGRKRSLAFLNEANELNLEDFRQINMRCTGIRENMPAMILDFNPSDVTHWIYDEVIPREDADTWITTYKDNLHLSEDLVYEIERMRERDPDYWRVYGEGLQAYYSKRQIFSNWEFIDYKDFPDTDNIYLGLDFGYSNDPLAICEVRKVNSKIYVHELCYKLGMTNLDTIKLITELKHDDKVIYYDAAEPKSGEDLRRGGLMAKAAVKGQGSVNAGISLLKEYDIILSKESVNFIKEYHSYYWDQLKDGTIVNKPVDKNNHLMDALRYCVYSAYGKAVDFFVI